MDNKTAGPVKGVNDTGKSETMTSGSIPSAPVPNLNYGTVGKISVEGSPNTTVGGNLSEIKTQKNK